MLTSLSQPTRSSVELGDSVQRLQNVMEYLVGELGNLAVLIGIDVPGVERLHLSTGHAELTRTEPGNPEHIFRIGSQTKTVVAMTLLLLERSGLLNMDDPVISLLDLPLDPRITVRHLCMNTSGLGEHTKVLEMNGAERFDPRIVYTPRELVALIKPQGQIFEPGDHFDYCNTGFVIASMVIEAVTGEAYGDVVRQRIMKPLGLNNTWFGGGAPQARMMRGYLTGPSLDGPLDNSLLISASPGSGDGISCLDDLLDLFGSLLDGTKGTGLTLADLTSVIIKPTDDPYFSLSIGAQYGMGIERRAWAGREVWGHPGSSDSYLTSTWIDPQPGIVVTTCVTRVTDMGDTAAAHLRYPREQLFAMALNTAYALYGAR